MSITSELKYLEKVQDRLVRFGKYLEAQKRLDGTNNYDDLYLKVMSVVGSIEDTLTFDELKSTFE